jgi:hypothetical protein
MVKWSISAESHLVRVVGVRQIGDYNYGKEQGWD